MANHDHHDHPNHPEVGHVVPVGLLVGVFVALLALTWITVAITWVDLGPFNIWVALLIAAVKGTLVVLYFMHLRWDSPFNSVVLVTSLLFLAIFISITLTDTFNYRERLDPPASIQRGL